jgi:hypothetical protein
VEDLKGKVDKGRRESRKKKSSSEMVQGAPFYQSTAQLLLLFFYMENKKFPSSFLPHSLPNFSILGFSIQSRRCGDEI